MIANKQAKRQAKRLFRLCLVNSLLDGNRVRQAVQHLIGSGSRNAQALLGQFVRLLRLDSVRHTARVESATPLEPDVQLATHEKLAHLYGPGLTTSFSHRPSLIGGMRIQIGSDVYDGTVQAGLAALEKSF